LPRPFFVVLLVLASIASHADPADIKADPANAKAVPSDIKAGPSDIEVKDAWIRWLPANLPGAGYMTLTNTGNATYALVGASSADYAEVSFHQTRNHDGMNEMLPVDTIVLKAHSSVRFAEGGYHLMLLQPRRALHPGDRVMVMLRFGKTITGDGRTINVPFIVRAGSETVAPPETSSR
jgi:copper(I)-binding protein